MPTAALNGTEIFYDTAGPADGPVLLLVHGGLGFDHAYFRPSFDRFADGFRVVFYDHRCNGRSARAPLDTLTMEQLADDAAALIDHLGAGEATVVGHSYGGFVAQETALRHPSHVAGLVLIGTTPGQLGTGESESPDEQGPPPPQEFVDALMTAPATDDELAATAAVMMRHFVHRAGPAAVQAVLDRTIFHAAAQSRGMEVLSAWSSVDRLPAIAAPTLCVVGRHDIACSWPQSYRIAKRVPGAEVVVLEDSGHFPWLDEPDAFFAALDAWLAGRA